MSNITITLTSLSSQRTESIEISPSATLSELYQYAIALLDLANDDDIDTRNNIVVLTKNAQRIYTPPPSSEKSDNESHHNSANSTNSTNSNGNRTLTDAGIQNGDLIVALVQQVQQPQRLNNANAASSNPTRSTASSTTTPTGGLDFSSLLNSNSSNVTNNNNNNNNNTNHNTSNNNASSIGAASSNNNNGGGLQFNLSLLSGSTPFSSASASASSQQIIQPTAPVQWDGMTLDDAIAKNPNPDLFVKVLFDEERHGNLFKELNYHSPSLARKLRSADLQNAGKIWRQEMQRNTLHSTMSKAMESQKEVEMERRLRSNPMDSEANTYFGEKIQKQNVDNQYRQMMEEFPESMGKVLMLYIDAKVNNHPIQAFVDSGAQSTIMSSKCAERCGLLHLLDERFAGTAVGVGTGKISGRIHMAQVQIANHYFPCTITIMDSEEGLGDKNMDFLLGLDMLKRHRCNIDLARNALAFRVGSNTFEANFLHEKDLDESKGGTRGFNADKNNAELEKMDEDAETK